MNDSVATTPAYSPEEHHDQRLRDMKREYDLFMENLNTLDVVLPSGWAGTRMGAEINNLSEQLYCVNSCLKLFAVDLQQDRETPPGKGDIQELKSCFGDIVFAINKLEKLLPAEDLPAGFAHRLQLTERREPGEARELPARNPAEVGGSVATKAVPDEKPAPKKKKPSRVADSFILPDRYTNKIRLTIAALKNYAVMAAPLVGATVDQTYMTEDARPDASVTELKEYSIQRRSANPVDFGVPEAWVKKLGLKIRLADESPAHEL